MPRLFRQSPLNAIWEGSGNVIALDVLRAIERDPSSVDALRAFLATAQGKNTAYDQWVDALRFTDLSEHHARSTVEHLALAAQAAVLIISDSPVAEAFCRLRLEEPAFAYGGSSATFDARTIIERALPMPR